MSKTTLRIGTENARPSLNQNLEALYNDQPKVGGAFDAKGIIKDGRRNLYYSDKYSDKHTPPGFKTRMKATEFNMVNTGKDTTMLKTSVYGPHSTRKYRPM